MGSSYVNTLVACDSSFMIQSLKEFHIPGIDYTFSINTTHVAMLLVSVFIIIMAIVARVKINKVKPDDTRCYAAGFSLHNHYGHSCQGED